MVYYYLLYLKQLIKITYNICILAKLILLYLALVFVCANPQYDEALAAKMIWLSANIYDTTPAEQASNICHNSYGSFVATKYFRNNGEFAMLGIDRSLQSVIAVFQGTNNTKNWFDDVNFFKSKYDGCKKCKIHTGFLGAYTDLQQVGLTVSLRKLVRQYPDYGIIFTGHSLGGAIAAIAALEYISNKPATINIKVYTLGQPRIGNQQYASYFHSQIPEHFRVIHKKDVVPHKPSYYSGYRHSGYQIWYNTGMRDSYLACQPEGEKCSNSVGYLASYFRVQDHPSRFYNQLTLKVKQHSENTAKYYAGIIANMANSKQFKENVKNQKKVGGLINSIINRENQPEL